MRLRHLPPGVFEAPPTQLRVEEGLIQRETRGEHRTHVAEMLLGTPLTPEPKPEQNHALGRR